MRDVLTGMIKAHEIQGVIALENSFNRVGIDHVVLVKVATTAVVANMIGCTYDEIVNAVSNAWIDGQSLRTYRHAPNAGSRKSWAAGDATSRGVRLALMALKGEMGYPSALTAKTWGFYDVLFKGKPFTFSRGIRLVRDGARAVQDLVPGRVPRADRGRMRGRAALARSRPARGDRESRHHHARVGDPHHRQERPAQQPGRPRSLHPVHDRDRPHERHADRARLRGRRRGRSAHRCAARQDGNASKTKPGRATTSIRRSARSPTRCRCSSRTAASTPKVGVEYPIGHRRRRKDGIPLLEAKFRTNLARRFAAKQQKAILEVCNDAKTLEAMPVHEFVDLFVV